MLADLSRHVVRALDERPCDVVIINRDDGQRNQEVHQEDHDRVDLRVHLVGHRIRDAVGEGDVGAVLSLALTRKTEVMSHERS